MGQDQNSRSRSGRHETQSPIPPPHRRFHCAACRELVILCPACDRGNIYCPICAPARRAARNSRARARYRASERGLLVRRAAEKRRRSRISDVDVGDRGSPTPTSQRNAPGEQSSSQGDPSRAPQNFTSAALSVGQRPPTPLSILRCTCCGCACAPHARQATGFRIRAWRAAQGGSGFYRREREGERP